MQGVTCPVSYSITPQVYLKKKFFFFSSCYSMSRIIEVSNVVACCPELGSMLNGRNVDVA
jgi:hypothetical protein